MKLNHHLKMLKTFMNIPTTNHNKVTFDTRTLHEVPTYFK